MNDFKKMMRNSSGFTLVELMIVVAIIGILSAVAVPNFKKYQAKAKSSEAKVQLAAAYTAEQSFYGDFGMYANCLSYMGYDPHAEIQSRYYAIGFGVAQNIAATMYDSAVNSGLAQAQCPRDNAQSASANPTPGEPNTNGQATFFPAGKSIAGGAAVTALTNEGGSSIGQQAAGSQQFKIAAEGIISPDKVVPTNYSILTIDQNKRLETKQPGY